MKTCDGHCVIVDGEEIKNSGPIQVGNHCWICSKSTILKNGFLGNDCILAYNSILNKKISDKGHLLYAGQPARVVKENVDWKL